MWHMGWEMRMETREGVGVVCVCFFFFSSRRRHTRCSRDWSSDVCSSDLIIRGAAWLMTRVMGASGAESLNVAASIFMGQTEAPLTIRPFLNKLTKSELM